MIKGDDMVVELWNGKVDKNMKDIGFKDKDMEMEHIDQLMDKYIKVNILME